LGQGSIDCWEATILVTGTISASRNTGWASSYFPGDLIRDSYKWRSYYFTVELFLSGELLIPYSMTMLIVWFVLVWLDVSIRQIDT
jgi:hypothetical protein